MPTFRLAIAAFAAVMSLAALASPAFATPGVTRQAVQVLSSPDSGAALLGNIARSQPIDIAGCSGNWCKVSGGGLSGWIAKSAITFKGIIQPPNIGSGGQAPQPGNNGGNNGGGNNNGGNHGGNHGGNNNNGGPGFSFDFNFGNDNPGPFPPQQPPRPPRPQPPQQSQACFYSATNFRGDSFCVDRGQSYAYLPDDWDNAIRSVEIFGRARVDLCRDEDMEGACATLRSSQSRLPDQIDRRVSSLEVY